MIALWQPPTELTGVTAAEADDDIVDPPQGASDLGHRIFSEFVASWSMAAQLGVPAVGSGDASKKKLLWVREEARWKVCKTRGGAKVRVGVAARQVVRISAAEASLKLSLPWLAAAATLNQVEASQTVAVTGYTGKLPKGARPQWSDLGVESYGEALGRFETLTAHVFDDEANFKPTPLGEFTWSSSTEVARAVGTLWGMMELGRRTKCMDALATLPEAFRESGDAQEAVREAYRNLMSVEDCSTEQPSAEVASRAVAELRGIALWNPR